MLLPDLRPTVLSLALTLAAPLCAVAQNTLDDIEREGLERIDERQGVQKQVAALNDETEKLIEEYRSELKIVRGLETYIEMLDQQLTAQRDEMRTLETSIQDVAVIERQILPLLARMVDGLEQFIRLDVPFLLDERLDRVTGLRALLRRSDVTVAEKSRRVFEAFQIENDFGYTIEAYRAKVPIDSGEFDADILRLGRVGLLYRTVGDARLGYWDREDERWAPLPSTPYGRLVEKGLRVARQEIAPELISIPLNPSKVSQP